MQPENSSLLSRAGRKMSSRQDVIYFDYCNYWHCWAPYLCGGCTQLTANPFFPPSVPCDTSILLISHPTCCSLESESVMCGNNIKHVHSQRDCSWVRECKGGLWSRPKKCADTRAALQPLAWGAW